MSAKEHKVGDKVKLQYEPNGKTVEGEIIAVRLEPVYTVRSPEIKDQVFAALPWNIVEDRGNQ